MTDAEKARVETISCGEICLECSRACAEAVATSLTLGGRYAEPRHINLLIDCMMFCQMSSNFLSRNSTQHPLTCGLCFEICTACAESCERYDDPVLQRCAEECRSCAASCQSMVCE